MSTYKKIMPRKSKVRKANVQEFSQPHVRVNDACLMHPQLQKLVNQNKKK